MSNGRDTSWPDGEGRALDAAGRALASGLEDARERLPDDVTMRRMWERARVSQPDFAVAAEPARPPRWLWFAGGVASTAALALAFAVWHGPRREVAKAPKATPTPASVVAAAEAPAMPAPEGTVRTGAGERLALSLAGGAEARLGSSSVLTVAHDGHAVVDGGEVSFTVTRREHARPYVVMAGPYRVVVLGARFRLSLDETKRVRVDAEDGEAEVWDQGRLARLGAGESWTSPAAAAPTGPATAALPRGRALALATPGADVADPEARAQAALAAGDVTHALGLYRALAKRGGPASENAAYEVGKLLRDRLGQPTSAVAAWRRYRADHPDGLLRVETDVSIIETLVHAGDTSGALGEANDFLRNHPDSERRAEIARIAGDLYRVRGELKRAVVAYQISLAAPKARDAEAATFHRAECLVRLGDPSGEEAARAYLRRWPDGRFRADAERLLTGGDDDGAARL